MDNEGIIHMPKLLNSRPMDELVCNGRPILVIDGDGFPQIFDAENWIKKESRFTEWMEIIRPDPKPDANGWYKSSEIQPNQEGKSVLAHNPRTYESYIITSWDNYWDRLDSDIYSHWRYIDLPVEI